MRRDLALRAEPMCGLSLVGVEEGGMRRDLALRAGPMCGLILVGVEDGGMRRDLALRAEPMCDSACWSGRWGEYHTFLTGR